MHVTGPSDARGGFEQADNPSNAYNSAPPFLRASAQEKQARTGRRAMAAVARPIVSAPKCCPGILRGAARGSADVSGFTIWPELVKVAKALAGEIMARSSLGRVGGRNYRRAGMGIAPARWRVAEGENDHGVDRLTTGC